MSINCLCCKETFKTNKDAKECEFCAKHYCKNCRWKTKEFPMSTDESRGEICKVCERKFHLKDMLKNQVQ